VVWEDGSREAPSYPIPSVGTLGTSDREVFGKSLSAGPFAHRSSLKKQRWTVDFPQFYVINKGQKLNRDEECTNALRGPKEVSYDKAR
jgi:hypothetical protein